MGSGSHRLLHLGLVVLHFKIFLTVPGSMWTSRRILVLLRDVRRRGHLHSALHTGDEK